MGLPPKITTSSFSFSWLSNSGGITVNETRGGCRPDEGPYGRRWLLRVTCLGHVNFFQNIFFLLNKKPLNSELATTPRSKVKGRRCRFRREHRGGFVDTTCHLVRKKMGEAGSSESRGEMTMSLRSSLTTQQRATVTVDRADLATVTFKFYYREGPSYFACHHRCQGGSEAVAVSTAHPPPPTHTLLRHSLSESAVQI